MMEPVYEHGPSLASGIPLGGIGTGSVELRDDGRFHDWEIFNNYLWSGHPGDAPNVSLRLAPQGDPERFDAVFVLPGAWGRTVLARTEADVRAEITVACGSLALRQIILPQASCTKAGGVVVLHDGRKMSAEIKTHGDGTLRIALGARANLTAGEALRIRIDS